jgi:hypothetical protein
MCPYSLPNPLRGCNSDLAQYSDTPSLRVTGFEDEDEDEDDDEDENASGSSSLPVFQSFPAKLEKGETLGCKAGELVRELRRT